MRTTQLLILSTTLCATTAWADPDDTADAALRRGEAAFKTGRIHDACRAFEASEQLEASFATELRLADCYAEDGKPVTAARLYRGLADKDPNAARSKKTMAKAAKLEANAPRLRFAINPRPDGLVVKVDGVAVASNQDVRVDLGPHEVIATAPGFEGHASAPVDHERVVVDVILRMEAHAEPPAPEPAKTPEPAPAPMPAATQMTPAPAAATVSAELPRRGNRRRNGLISAATGAGLLAGAVVLLELSSSKYDDEHALCPRSMCKDLADLDQARSDQHQAQAFRGVSLGMGIGGTLLVATGAYLYFTSHDETPRVSVQAGRGSAGLSLNGRF